MFVDLGLRHQLGLVKQVELGIDPHAHITLSSRASPFLHLWKEGKAMHLTTWKL